MAVQEFTAMNVMKLAALRTIQYNSLLWMHKTQNTSW